MGEDIGLEDLRQLQTNMSWENSVLSVFIWLLLPSNVMFACIATSRSRLVERHDYD